MSKENCNYNNQHGSCIVLVLILGAVLMTQVITLTKSIRYYQQNTYFNLMEAKVRYAALSGLTFSSLYVDNIPVENQSYKTVQNNIDLLFKNSFKLSHFNEIEVGLIIISNTIYSIAIYNDFKSIDSKHIKKHNL